MLWHLSRVERPSVELSLVLICGAIGAIWDSLLVNTGWIQYPSGYVISTGAPYWIVAMWMLFATTLNVSLRWLRSSVLLAALLGFIGGPLSYYTGAKLGGVIFVNSSAALLALAIGWAVLMPILMSLSVRFDGVEVRPVNRTGWILE